MKFTFNLFDFDSIIENAKSELAGIKGSYYSDYEKRLKLISDLEIAKRASAESVTLDLEEFFLLGIDKL